MPIYEYRCRACAEKFELLVASERQSREQRCPNCGSADIEKLFSVFSSAPTKVPSCGGCKFT